MQVILTVADGPLRGRNARLRPGQTVKIGRGVVADLAFPHDTEMADEQFLLRVSGDACEFVALAESTETLVNGRPSAKAYLQDGDELRAGGTVFSVHIVGPVAKAPAAQASAESPAAKDVSIDEFKQKLLSSLENLGEPLYGILDAARDPLVLARLVSSDHQYQSLYEGRKAAQLTAVAPYLVKFPPASPLLAQVIQEGWGKSWGIFFPSVLAFDEVRKHFRKFLIVENDEGEKLYFRFYDPRVLRVFLPHCNEQERRDFFGPLEWFLLEDEDPSQLLRWSATTHAPTANM